MISQLFFFHFYLNKNQFTVMLTMDTNLFTTAITKKKSSNEMNILADLKNLKLSCRGFIDFRSLFRHYIVNDETDHYKVVSVKLVVHANHNYNVR